MSYSPAKESMLTKSQVYGLAESVAKQLDFHPGNDIYSLVNTLGGQINVEDTLLSDPESSGSLYVNGEKQFRIVIPSHTSPERDRFTLAHELGHYVLHYLWQKKRDPRFPDRVMAFRRGSDRMEWEANWFAAAFLMPQEQFKTAFTDCDRDIRKVAEIFGVSVAAAEVRARGLGLS